MRILWVSHLVPNPPKAGVLLRSHNLVKELSRHHHVDLLAFNQKGLVTPYFESYEQGTMQSYEFLSSICNKIRFIDCPMDKRKLSKFFCAMSSLIARNPYSVNWLKSKDFAQALAQMCQESNYDAIHFDTISLAPYINYINSDKPVVLTLDHHNVESHMLIRRAQQETNILRKIYFYQEGFRLQRIEEKYCPMFHSNITCSELDSNRFATFIKGANFKSIPNGVDVDFFKPSHKQPESKRLIFIGTLDWYPNTRAVRFIAKEIWPRVKLRIPDIKIDIIGSRPPSDIVDISQAEANFNVHGFVDDIQIFLDTATAYVCPINDGGGTKLKILDAFSSGKAVIADPIACEGLNAQDEHNVLFASTPDEFVAQIERIINNPDLRMTLESNARKHVEDHFSFRAIGQELAEHFDQLHRQMATINQGQ